MPTYADLYVIAAFSIATSCEYKMPLNGLCMDRVSLFKTHTIADMCYLLGL